jgi:hypothetical protein
MRMSVWILLLPALHAVAGEHVRRTSTHSPSAPPLQAVRRVFRRPCDTEAQSRHGGVLLAHPALTAPHVVGRSNVQVREGGLQGSAAVGGGADMGVLKVRFRVPYLPALLLLLLAERAIGSTLHTTGRAYADPAWAWQLGSRRASGLLTTRSCSTGSLR